MPLIREPIWAHLRERCNSFASMSANAVFSDIFRLNTVGAMTQELKSLFLIQQSNQSVCSFCSNALVKETNVFVLYLTFANLLQSQFETYVSEAILPNSCRLYCDLCQKHSGDISILQHFVTLPKFLSVELSSHCINQVIFPMTMDVLGEGYVLKGMVRSLNHHFTVAITDNTHWVYIDDMCVSVKSYSSLQNLLHNHCNGWFFAIFEKTAIVVNNTVVPNSVMCNPFQQDGNKEHKLDSPLLQSNSGIYKTVHKDTNNLSVNNFMQRNLTKCKTFQEDSQTDNLPLCSLETDIPSNDNTMNIGTVTKSSAIAFYGICFSVLKPCSYWKSDTLHAIVECGSAFFEDIGKGNAKVSELPHALNIYGGNIDVRFALSSKGTLVCDSSSSVLVLNRFIAQNMVTNTGFLFYLPSVTFGCVFHKTKRSTSLFFLSLESHGLEVLRTNDTNCLVQTICQFVTKKLNCDKTEYCIQCLLCSCQLTKAQKLNILKYHKTSKEKRDIASNKRKFYAELEPAKKRICLDKARQHYEDNKEHILTARKENHRSMDTIEKQQFLARRRQTYQNVKSEQKEDIAAETVTQYLGYLYQVFS